MKSASKLAGLLTALLFLATFAKAATVTGSVKSPDGTPFRGAFVQAQNAGTHVLVSVLTDKDGRYRIENLPAGKYQVQVKAILVRQDADEDARACVLRLHERAAERRSVRTFHRAGHCGRLGERGKK